MNLSCTVSIKTAHVFLVVGNDPVYYLTMVFVYLTLVFAYKLNLFLYSISTRRAGTALIGTVLKVMTLTI